MRNWRRFIGAIADEVRFTRPALDDLASIHTYISKDNPAAASRVVMRLIDRALEIANAPYQGREVDEPNACVVVLPRFRYLIFYAIQGEEIRYQPYSSHIEAAALGPGMSASH